MFVITASLERFQQTKLRPGQRERFRRKMKKREILISSKIVLSIFVCLSFVVNLVRRKREQEKHFRGNGEKRNYNRKKEKKSVKI